MLSRLSGFANTVLQELSGEGEDAGSGALLSVSNIFSCWSCCLVKEGSATCSYLTSAASTQGNEKSLASHRWPFAR